MSDLIDKNEAALSAHERICEVRYESICARLKRLEQILIVNQMITNFSFYAHKSSDQRF
jgi:hypothetical protein